MEPKMVQNPFKKQSKNQSIFGPFFDRFWLHFGLQLGSNLDPTWPNLVPTWLNLAPTWPHLVPTPTWSQLGANLGPTWANLEPIWGQLVTNLEPTWPQLGPKMASTWPKFSNLAPTCLRRSQLSPTCLNLLPSWPNLASTKVAQVYRVGFFHGMHPIKCQAKLPDTGGRRWFAKRTEYPPPHL